MFNWRYYHIKNILFYHLFFFIWVGIWRNKQMTHLILSGNLWLVSLVRFLSYFFISKHCCWFTIRYTMIHSKKMSRYS